ncbi:MAG: DUF3833 domain-containing protein [Burkholderiales bacterium]
MTFRAVVLVFTIAVAGCASVDLSEYAKEKPVFDLMTYFDGTVDGWGMVQNRSGKVTQRFYVRVDGRVEGDRLTMEEHFEYDDGRKERKTWQLVKSGERYTGRREDTVGEGAGGQEGNAFNIRYVLRVPVEGRTWDIDMNDWMYLIDERTVLNRTRMTKFGVRVGEVSVAFRKR